MAALYYTFYRLGRLRNESLARNWILANQKLLTEQFAQFGIPSADGRQIPFSDDGAGVYESYATGRVGINRLWIEIRTLTRHDVVAYVLEIFVGFLFDVFGPGEDLVEVNIEPNVEWEGFTWAVVRKQNMKRLRETRYDLVWFPRSLIGIVVDS